MGADKDVEYVHLKVTNSSNTHFFGYDKKAFNSYHIQI